MQIKVSVIIPYYNDLAYIQDALDSVFRQSYPHLEVIIVDDGSEECLRIDSLMIPQGFAVRILRGQHGGPSSARNLGIQAATGSVILPLDADDKIAASYIEKAVEIIESNDQIGIVYCQACKFGAEQGRWVLPEYSLPTMLAGNCIFVTALFRKRDWEAVGGFSENMTYGLEDYDFWLKLISRGAQVYCLPEILFYYRIKEQSRSKQMEESKQKILSMYDQIYENHNVLYSEHIQEVLRTLRGNVLELDAALQHAAYVHKLIIKWFPLVRFGNWLYGKIFKAHLKNDRQSKP